jgi:SAM-dependent methyltransferase
MASEMSQRLQEIVAALPLKEGQRILEIGCGTGVVAREIIKRINDVYVLGLDRSAKAIAQCMQNSHTGIATGKLHFQKGAIENFELDGGELFDFAFAIRVGALDGRHPEIEEKALTNIAKALKTNGRLFIDGGSPLLEVDTRKYMKAKR